jgi:hypothetical protein
MYECDIWNFPRGLLSFRFKRNWVERIEFYNQTLSRHKIVTGKDLSTLRDIHRPEDLYKAFGTQKNADVSGEKSPFYCSRLIRLHKLYPDAAFILVSRDPIEVYRSVVKAGQTSRFFGKSGMLSRMIFHQEELIRQSKIIDKLGARVFQVDYAGIVDKTEVKSRELCAFLKVPFDPKMLELNKADLSAIYKAPHHAYLRKGIIARQQYGENLLSRKTVAKLERYRNRWSRLQSQSLPSAEKAAPSGPEPGIFESAFHNVAGRLLTVYDSTVRAGFEFMPIPWLRVYRLLKTWIVNPPSGDLDEPTSVLKDFTNHWHTIVTAGVLLASIAAIHYHSNPHLLFLLFYGIPCALLALVVNYRWATLFAFASAAIGPMIQYEGDADYRSVGVYAWNFVSRFILLEFMILTLGRIRMESSKSGKDPTAE